MLLTLSGCLDSSGINKVNFNSINYNNDTYDTFWADRDTVFYQSMGLYTTRIFMNNNGRKKRLLHSNDFGDERLQDHFQPVTDFAYFETVSNETDDSFIYKYKFSDRTYKKIFTTNNIYQWMGTKNFIAFTKWSEDFDYENYDENYDDRYMYVYPHDLFFYDIKSKKEILICKNIYDSAYNG